MTSENLALNFAARSDRGLVRGNNEDSAVAASHLLALADGMGGHAAGEVASQLMIEALLPLNAMFHGDAPGSAPAITPDRLPGLLVEAMDAGNRAIAAHVDENPTLDGMGCTLSSLLFLDGRMGVCHVGDSRGYLLRDGVLTQITKDDTYVQSLVDEGKLDPADVSSHPQRSLILKALTGRPVEPTLQLLDTLPGDRFMLCSDGLSDPVSADTIREVLGEGTPDTAASRLIDLALRGGGPDNVTVVVADVVDMDATEGAGSVDLPTTAALAGAINSDETELPRPDTAAGRAMAVNVVNRSTPPADGDASDPAGTGESPTAPTDDMPPMRRPRRVGSRRTAGTHGDPAGADPTDPGRVDSPDPRHAKRRRRILVTVTVIVALVVIAGIGGWIAKRNLDDSYFVAVASSDDVPEPSTTATATTMPATTAAPEGTAPAAPSAQTSAAAAATTRQASPSTTPDTTLATTLDTGDAVAAAKGVPILIYQGAPGSFLGIPLHSAYQEICLSEDAEIRLLPAGSEDPCHRFSTADLTPAARGTLDTLPRDSYQSVQDQLRRLSAQTLPICVTRRSDSTDGDPSDLTTPGVSCREVN